MTIIWHKHLILVRGPRVPVLVDVPSVEGALINSQLTFPLESASHVRFIDPPNVSGLWLEGAEPG